MKQYNTLAEVTGEVSEDLMRARIAELSAQNWKDDLDDRTTWVNRFGQKESSIDNTAIEMLDELRDELSQILKCESCIGHQPCIKCANETVNGQADRHYFPYHDQSQAY